jgi:hypothetical protein
MGSCVDVSGRLAAVLALVGGLAAVEPLPIGGSQAEAVGHALIALTQGDAGPLTALPPAAWTAAVGWTDRGNPAVVRRWTTVLPQALTAIPAERRATVVQALAALAGDHAELAAALDLRAAPAAASVVRRAADRAFDRGRHEDFLDLAAAIGIDDGRLPVARAVAGWSAVGSLAAPAPPAPATVQPLAVAAGKAGWQVIATWLLRTDAAGRVAWQRRLLPGDQVATGAGAALVTGAAGTAVVAADGSEHALPPMPAGVTPLAVAGGAAWFAWKDTAWRVALDSGAWQPISLPELPLAPPLVAGGDAWWLGRRAIHHSRDGRIIASTDHGREVDGLWRLIAGVHGRFLVDGGGACFAIGDLDAALAVADAPARARLLLAAHRPAEALAAAGDDPALRLRAGIALGRPDPADARTAQDRVLFALATRAGDDALATAIAGHDDLILTSDPSDALWRDPVTWDHRLTSRAWRLAHVASALPSTASSSPVVATAQAAPPPLTVAVERRRDRLSIAAGDAAGRLWQTTWDTADFLAMPVVAAEDRGTAIVVCEGESRAVVVDRRTGLRSFVVSPRQRTVVAGQVAVLPGIATLVQAAPIGVGTRLDVIDARSERSEPLPRPARWVVGLGREAVIAFADGTAAAWPGLRPIELPADLLRARQTVATADGIVADGRLWAWR